MSSINDKVGQSVARESVPRLTKHNLWAAEANRRLQDFRSGAVKGIPGEKAVAALREKLRQEQSLHLNTKIAAEGPALRNEVVKQLMARTGYGERACQKAIEPKGRYGDRLVFDEWAAGLRDTECCYISCVVVTLTTPSVLFK